MSGFGFSPSDIVKAISTVIQAVDALKNEDGARSRYIETEHNLDSTTKALRALQALLESSNPTVDTSDARSALEALLLDTEARHRRLTEKYGDALGPNTSQKRHHGIFAKERYSFRGEKQEREATLRAIEGFHAVTLDTIT